MSRLQDVLGAVERGELSAMSIRPARVEQVRRTSGPKRSTHADTAEEIGPNFCEHPYRLDISTYADHARGVERWLCGGCKSVGESPWPPA